MIKRRLVLALVAVAVVLAAMALAAGRYSASAGGHRVAEGDTGISDIQWGYIDGR